LRYFSFRPSHLEKLESPSNFRVLARRLAGAIKRPLNKGNIMSIEKSVKYNGITVFWSLTDGTSISKLRDGFDLIGRQDLLPDTQNVAQALRRAIQQNFPTRNKIIRPLKGGIGFAVVHEEETIDENNNRKLVHEEELRVVYSGCILSNPCDHPKMDAIEEAFRVERQQVTAAKLGGILVKACNGLSGIPLRPRGGFYWIPNSKADEWESIVNVIEQANPSNRVWRMKTTTDNETVDAVCDSLVIEVEKQLENLSESILTEDLGKRALKTKETNALELKALVSEYEQILGKTLTKLQEKAEEVHASASVALLQCL